MRPRELSAHGVENIHRQVRGPRRLAKENLDMKMRRTMLLAIAAVIASPVLATAQALADSGDPSGTVATTISTQPDVIYVRPTQKTKLHNYVFDAFGPYPLAGAAFAAGIGQAYDTPPEWKQGARGFWPENGLELRHRGSNHDYSLRVGTGLQRRHAVLPLWVQRIVSAIKTRGDFHGDRPAR